MSWSRKAGFSFGPSERLVFEEVCQAHRVPARLVEELLELEVSDQRHKKGPVAEKLRYWAGREDHSDNRLRPTPDGTPDGDGAYRLLSLRMTNFCLFSDAHLDFRWTPGRPLCLVEGNNGYGKTKLIEALRFVLHGLPERANPLDLLHRGAEKPRARVEVQLELSTPDGETARLRRSIEFAMMLGEWNVERQAFVAKVGNRALQDQDAQEWVDARLPRHVMECFVFDAENSPVAALAAGGAGAGVADQLEKVLGVTLLRNVATRVAGVEKEWARELDTASPRQSVRQARAAQEEVEAAIEKVEQDIEELTGQVRRISDEKTRVNGELEKLLNHFDPAAEEARDRRAARAATLAKEEEEHRQSLVECVGRSLPIQLLYEHVRFALESSRAARRDEEAGTFRCGIDHAVRSIARLVADGKLPWDEQPVPAVEAIASRLFRSLELPDDRMEEEAFKLPDSTMTELQAAMDEALRIPTPATHVGSLRTTREQLATLRGGSTERTAPTNTDLSVRHGRLTAELDDFAQQLARRQLALDDRRSTRNGLVTQQEQKRLEAQQAEEDESRQGRLRANWDFAVRVHQSLRTLADRLRGLRVEELERGATEMFRQTTNKPELYASVVFDRETLRYHVIDHDGYPAPLDRSTGERAVLSLAVVHGLQRASGRSLPLVVEAPVKPLDPVHTERVIRHAFRAASGQTVLLLKPDEVPTEHREALLSRTGQRFVLERPHPERELSIVTERTE
jgi:DNA sulfur modification protein DndD